MEDRDRSRGMEIRTESLDWAIANRYRMRHYKGARATVPGGHEVAIDDDFVDVAPPGAEYDGVIDRIRDFLKHPKAGCMYIWRPRMDESTFRLIELHYIRPVLFSELTDRAATVGLNGYQESGIPDAEGHRTVQTYAGWRKAGLYEVRPDKSKEWFIDPGRYHLRLIRDMPDQVEDQFAEEGVGTAVLTQKDRRTQAEEVALEQRRGK